MARLSDDCFASGDEILSVEDAVRLIGERVGCVALRESVPLDAADGRVLAADIVAPVDLPGFDNSAVDGFAVRSGDLGTGETVLPVERRVAAGGAPVEGRAGTAVRIFTGAAMPAGFDTVFMQEDVRLEGGRVRLPSGLAAGANRRLAGEDLRQGGTALPAGRRLAPPDLALLGALGLADVAVRARLRVSLFSTGDEVSDGGGARLAPGRLFDANRPMLAALLRRRGCRVADRGILPDRREAVAAALRGAAAESDLLITSGGVSAGDEDHVRAAVEGSGALAFWRLGIKPGRPAAMGVVGGTPFLGLPGNPVAAFVTFAFLARPLVARLSGETFVPPVALPVTAAFGHRKKAGRREFVRVRLVRDEAGQVAAVKHPRDGAGIITSLTETDGLADLPETATAVAPGEGLAFLPYASLF